MRAFRLILPLIVIVILAAVGAYAQKYGIHTKTLVNGLDVIVVQNPVVPLVTIEIDVKNGAYTESPEFDGLSHLYEHMFFKANRAIPNQERYLERLRELGAIWNGTTGNERVNYFITLPKDSLASGLEFMCDAVTGPLFQEDELVKERPVVTGEYDRAESDPFFLLNRAVDQKVWWKYFSRKNVLGDRQVILTTTQEKMRTIQHRYYIPNNSALLIAGDITPDEGFTLAEKTYSSWEREPDPFKQYPIPENPPIQSTESVVVEAPVNAVTIRRRWQGPSVYEDTKATYAADVLSYILRQRTSHFYRVLVDSGLAISVSFDYNTLEHTGPITLFAQTTADRFQRCRAAIDQELHRMASSEYFTDEQLENAKTILAINEQYGRERPTEFIHTVGYWWAVAGLDYYLDYIENLRKVTREDIKEYLDKYVIGKRYIEGILVSASDRKRIGL
jgi:zinc protease